MITERLRNDLIQMAASVGGHERMAILGEGNISGAVDDETFLVKASGVSLAGLTEHALVEVRTQALVDVVEETTDREDADIESLLLAARVDAAALKPSVESLFHAWLLRLPNVRFVAHAHPIAVNQLLCSPAAQQYARKRLFPDQIVYCGPESVLVPYVDPGLRLARRIAAEVEAFRLRSGRVPMTILLENHGIVTLGATASEAVAAIQMAEKSAAVFLGAASAGGPVFMSPDHVRRIADRMDEHYRQRMLRGEDAS